jgi:hypothetical protein
MLLAPLGLLLRLLLGWVCGYAAAHALFPPKGEEKKGKGERERHARRSLEHERAGRQPVRMLMARAKTMPIVISDAADCTSISSLAGGVSGIVSVGLKAVALVNEV